MPARDVHLHYRPRYRCVASSSITFTRPWSRHGRAREARPSTRLGGWLCGLKNGSGAMVKSESCWIFLPERHPGDARFEVIPGARHCPVMDLHGSSSTRGLLAVLSITGFRYLRPVLAVCNPNPILQSGVLDSMGAISRLCHFAQRCDSDGLPPLGTHPVKTTGLDEPGRALPIRRHVMCWSST